MMFRGPMTMAVNHFLICRTKIFDCVVSFQILFYNRMEMYVGWLMTSLRYLKWSIILVFEFNLYFFVLGAFQISTIFFARAQTHLVENQFLKQRLHYSLVMFCTICRGSNVASVWILVFNIIDIIINYCLSKIGKRTNVTNSLQC